MLYNYIHHYYGHYFDTSRRKKHSRERTGGDEQPGPMACHCHNLWRRTFPRGFALFNSQLPIVQLCNPSMRSIMIAAVSIVGVEWYFRAGRLDGGVQASSWGDPWWHRQRSCQVILGLADFPECVLFSIWSESVGYFPINYSCPLEQSRSYDVQLQDDPVWKQWVGGGQPCTSGNLADYSLYHNSHGPCLCWACWRKVCHKLFYFSYCR